MSKSRYIILLFVVLLLALFTRWLLRSVETPPASSAQQNRHTPDYFLTNFTSTLYDNQGTATYNIQAIRMVHYPDDNTHELSNPEFSYLPENDSPWIAISDSGTIYADQELIHLNGDVTIRQTSKQLPVPMVLNTQDLRINLDKKTADTKAKVKITGNKSVVTATGMHLDMDKGIMILKSKARGHYAPR